MKSKLDKPKTLRQLAGRHWAEIERGTLLFDRQDREAAALRELTKRDVIAFFQVNGRPSRHDPRLRTARAGPVCGCQRECKSLPAGSSFDHVKRERHS